MPDFRTNLFRFGTHKRVVAALLLSAITVGCTAPGNHGYGSKHEPTYLRMTEERAFAQSLRQRYLELASNAFDRGDLQRSDFYSLRALMSVEGKLAHPILPERSGFTSGSPEEAASAYNRLDAALSSGVRTGSPDLAARAQAAYDCWMIEAAQGGNPTIAQSCRYNTLEALSRLESASVGARITQAGGPQYQTPGYVAPQPQVAHQGYAAPQAAPQRYVIEPGTPSRTIQANGAAGMTIEIIHKQAAPQVSYQAPRVVHTAQPVRVQRSYAPVRMQAAPVQYAAPQRVQSVRRVPVQRPARMGPTYVEFDNRAGFDHVPVMSAEDVAMLSAGTRQHSAPIHVEPAQMRRVAPTINLGPVDMVGNQRSYDSRAVPMVTISEAAIRANGTAEALVAAQASQQSDFAIYFGFDSADITLEAEDVLVDTVERIKLSGARHVTLTGFTDSMGDARYNQLLAMRRAQAVRKYLQQAVGDSVQFDLLPVGEVVAVQNTGDGVMEALNRRVEVSIQ